MHAFDKLLICCLFHFEEDFSAYTMEGVTAVTAFVVHVLLRLLQRTMHTRSQQM
jgi:hypothetical protein